eukprot:EG_transcript_3782
MPKRLMPSPLPETVLLRRAVVRRPDVVKVSPEMQDGAGSGLPFFAAPSLWAVPSVSLADLKLKATDAWLGTREQVAARLYTAARSILDSAHRFAEEDVVLDVDDDIKKKPGQLEDVTDLNEADASVEEKKTKAPKSEGSPKKVAKAARSGKKAPSGDAKGKPKPVATTKASSGMGWLEESGGFPMPNMEKKKEVDEVDPETGIRQSLLRILRAADDLPGAKKKKAPPATSKAKLAPGGHRPDPEDRLFPKPVIWAEPATKKRERRSIMLKYLTEMDNWKLDNFYLTWDCTFCLRTFPDKESLGEHKAICDKRTGNPLGARQSLTCLYCKKEFPSEQVLTSHKQHSHGHLKEVKHELQLEKLRVDVEKIQKWVDECDIDAQRVDNCTNTLHQLSDTLISMKVYFAANDNSTRQLAGREMMVMVDIAVKATALGCSTSAVSVADITSANPTVVAGLFHAIAHLEGYGLLSSSLRQDIDDTRRKRNIVFHTLGVVLDEEGLTKQLNLAVNTISWAQLLMDRTLNVVQHRDPSLPRFPKIEPVVVPIDPNVPRLPNGALASGPAPYVPPGVKQMGNQSGIPAWKYTAPAVPILNEANVLLGSKPMQTVSAKPGVL